LFGSKTWLLWDVARASQNEPMGPGPLVLLALSHWALRPMGPAPLLGQGSLGPWALGPLAPSWRPPQIKRLIKSKKEMSNPDPPESTAPEILYLENPKTHKSHQHKKGMPF